MEWWQWELIKWLASICLTLFLVVLGFLKPDWFDIVEDALV
jgi:hypothetical protein